VSSRLLPRLAVALSLAAIASATLVSVSPDVGWRPRAVAFCLTCGDDAGLDALNNVLLFLPFGAAAAAAGWRRRTAVLFAAIAATAIESIQFTMLTGRYASAGDVCFNTAGALAGWVLVTTRRAWFAPAPRGAAGGAIGAAVVFVAIAAGTGWLLAPRVPDPPLAGQRIPRRAVVFTGTLHEAALNGRPLPPGPLRADETADYRAHARMRHVVIEAEITPGAPPDGFAPIVRLATGDVVHLALGQTRDSIAFIPALRSRMMGFRTIAIRVPVPAGMPWLHVVGAVEPAALRVTAAGEAGRFERRVPLTASLGWALLLPVRATIGPWSSIASAGWLAVLLVPAGYYAVAASDVKAGRSWPRRRRVRYLWVAPPAAIVLGLGLVPAWLGIAATAWTDWVAAGTGVGVGAIVYHVLRRARFLHGALAEPWTAKPHDTTAPLMRQAR
jgi:hypothetical protein